MHPFDPVREQRTAERRCQPFPKIRYPQVDRRRQRWRVERASNSEGLKGGGRKLLPKAGASQCATPPKGASAEPCPRSQTIRGNHQDPTLGRDHPPDFPQDGRVARRGFKSMQQENPIKNTVGHRQCCGFDVDPQQRWGEFPTEFGGAQLDQPLSIFRKRPKRRARRAEYGDPKSAIVTPTGLYGSRQQAGDPGPLGRTVVPRRRRRRHRLARHALSEES